MEKLNVLKRGDIKLGQQKTNASLDSTEAEQKS
jgi:hypothetical protein